MKTPKHLATVMAITMVAGSVAPVMAATTSSETIIGNDRHETAVKISKEGWKGAETVILVNSSAIPDALTATPLAHAKKAPILLTGKDGLNKATANEIKRLGAKDVIMIGGDAVLSAKVEKDLKALKVKVDRIKGATREETALAIAKRLDGIKDVSEIAVVNGTTGLADAVSVAAAAAEKGMPILLANPKKGLSAAEKFIKDEAIKASFVIGGTTVLPEKLVSSLPGKQRIEGLDRKDTNAKVIEKFYTGKELNNVYLAKDGMGDSGQLIDALAVGALAAKNGAPVLIASKKLSEKQIDVINTKKIDTITQVGGKGNEGAFNQLKDIEKEDVYEVGTVEELKEALEKANANDKIVLKPNTTITEDIIINTDKNVDIKVEGTVTGKVEITAPNGNVTDNSTSKPNGGGSTNTPSGPSVEERYAAEVNGTKYETLEAAVDAVVNSDGTNNVTVKLLKNSSGNGIIFKNSKNITIDLNGKTYTINGKLVGSPGTESNGFQLLEGNKVTIKNGNIETTNAAILLQNYCDLTLENLNLKGGNPTKYVLSCNNGNTVLTNVNISGSHSSLVGIDVMHYYTKAPKVTVNNTDANIINGKIDVYCGESDHKGDKPTLIINGGNFTGNLDNHNNQGVIIDTSKQDVVAEVNGTTFTTLEDAVKSVGTEATTINLLKNVNGNGIVFENKNITIDLNGHTYTIDGTLVGSPGTESNGFQLLEGSNVTIKNGNIETTNAAILLQNYCDLTLENLNLKGGNPTKYVLSCNNGNTVLTNVNINGSHSSLVGIDVMHWQGDGYEIAPTVVINNTDSNTIKGKVDVYCAESEHKGEKPTLTINGGKFTGTISNSNGEGNIIDNRNK